MEGRWLQTRSVGTLMGKELETFSLMGYDNFKQSYVSTAISSMDTAMNRSEGDLAPNGKTLASGSGDELVKIWNVGTGECLCTLQGHVGSVTEKRYSTKKSCIPMDR